MFGATLQNNFSRSYQDFDLSDDTFQYSRSDWRNYVPQEIQQNWKVLNSDERFLVALTAEVACDLDE